MTTLLTILVASFAVLALGRKSLRKEVERMREQMGFADAWLRDFADYVRSNGRRDDLYVSLLQRSHRLQRDMGRLGLIDYKPPFSSAVHRNVPVILNFVPEVNRNLVHDRSPVGMEATDAAIHIGMIRDKLEQYRGDLAERWAERAADCDKRSQRFAAGLRQIVFWPVWLLGEIGLFSRETAARFKGSRTERVLAALLGLLSVTASVLTVLQFWRESTR